MKSINMNPHTSFGRGRTGRKIRSILIAEAGGGPYIPGNNELEKTLWAAADKLRSDMDAAGYKHIILGLIFLKYISDAFSDLCGQLKAGEGEDEAFPSMTKKALTTKLAEQFARGRELETSTCQNLNGIGYEF